MSDAMSPEDVERGNWQRRRRLLAEALEVGLRVEWEGDSAVNQCPCCRRWQMQGHEADCALDRGLDDLCRELGVDRPAFGKRT